MLWAEMYAVVIIAPVFFSVFFVAIGVLNRMLPIELSARGPLFLLGVVAVLVTSRLVVRAATSSLQTHRVFVSSRDSQRWCIVAVAVATSFLCVYISFSIYLSLMATGVN